MHWTLLLCTKTRVCAEHVRPQVDAMRWPIPTYDTHVPFLYIKVRPRFMALQLSSTYKKWTNLPVDSRTPPKTGSPSGSLLDTASNPPLPLSRTVMSVLLFPSYPTKIQSTSLFLSSRTFDQTNGNNRVSMYVLDGEISRHCHGQRIYPLTQTYLRGPPGEHWHPRNVSLHPTEDRFVTFLQWLELGTCLIIHSQYTVKSCVS